MNRCFPYFKPSAATLRRRSRIDRDRYTALSLPIPILEMPSLGCDASIFAPHCFRLLPKPQLTGFHCSQGSYRQLGSDRRKMICKISNRVIWTYGDAFTHGY